MSIRNQILSSLKDKEYILFILSACLVVGIFYSRAITTTFLIGILICSLRYVTFDKIKSFFRDQTLMPFILVFVAGFGSYSDDQVLWQTALRVKLPFLVMPFAFYLLPKLGNDRLVMQLHYWLIAVVVAVQLPVLVHALSNYDAMLSLLSRGQPIPTPIEHVKYSMFSAYAAISGLYLIKHDHHVGRIAIQLSPTLQQKIGYMNYDWDQYQKMGGHEYSDSERIMSYKAAIDMILSNPIIGVGYGDVLEESHLYYDQAYGRSELYKLPHSQFLLTLAGSGILGFLIFVAGFYVPSGFSLSKLQYLFLSRK